MTNSKLLNNIINEIIDIIKNNNKNLSINKISNLINPITRKKIGKKDAENIYLEHCKKSVSYDKYEHKNNVNDYVKKVNNKNK